MNANNVLYNYIIDKYGDVASFSDSSGIPPVALNAVLLKENVSGEIGIGLNLCDILNIDVEKMVFDAQITNYEKRKPGFVSISNKHAKSEKSKKLGAPNKAVNYEIYDRCIRLSEIEKKEVLSYMERVAIGEI